MPHLTDDDIYYWRQGTHAHSYERMGAHPNQRGTWFGVWAPNADRVEVTGDFNDWRFGADVLERREGGLWEGYVRGAQPGDKYKYHLRADGEWFDRTDPYAFRMEPPAQNTYEGLSALITDLDTYTWGDTTWMNEREGPSGIDGPLSIYEVHLGSWRHEEHGESLSYREVAEPLADHVQNLGFTHVEFLPLAEHPYYGSWGYQILGYYAPTFRYGDPEGLMHLIDTLHQRGIGVIMDWVPGHFATDPQGLTYFDGSHLFEYEDPLMREHPDWGTRVFDFGKNGVRNFLLSNALFWMDKYHVDGLRVDAVASMLYRDYSREGDWSPNVHGGRENLGAISLLQDTNERVYDEYPEAIMLAEESTAWPGVTTPTEHGGLGFLYKWNMGWMHDTLEYASTEPVHRKHHHGDLTWTLSWAFSENYTLPLSHDEVVHGKSSLWSKMPGDDWQKAANLRLLYAHMFGHPGKKLLFMGGEFGQYHEWNHDEELEWRLTEEPLHEGLMEWLGDLNHLYQNAPALWNDQEDGFEWIAYDDRENSVLTYRRLNGDRSLVFVLNFTPVVRENYRIGTAGSGRWHERLNSDSHAYGGSNVGNQGLVHSDPIGQHGHSHSLELTLPPLGALVLEPAE
ncbi:MULTISPECIES: 1,4-alpha-glucan branching protein GlgB [Salinibacter]|uniref:1,4-alpha-glucan branching protein GlgB n=1 Tax=Salinibacter TaxID=146918 RepID=UPI001ABA12C9|nr:MULTISPECIES: 1,4-alpha-glucan branching protein GlgB [Salinibacter]